MACLAARITIDPSDGRRSRCHQRGHMARLPERDVSDRLALVQGAAWLEAQQPLLRDAEIDGGEVSRKRPNNRHSQCNSRSQISSILLWRVDRLLALSGHG